MADIYEKLFKIREAIKKERPVGFPELMDAVRRKTKYHRVIPLYTYFDNTPVLELVNMDDIKDTIKFMLPDNHIKGAADKQSLYMMAFDVDSIEEERISAKQYALLVAKMKEKNVDEKEVLERYKLNNLTEMTEDIYKRCMSVFEKMK